jgi:hypothetical protein
MRHWERRKGEWGPDPEGFGSGPLDDTSNKEIKEAKCPS